MNTTLVASLVTVGTAAVVIGFSYISAYNAGNRMEQNIEATWENNKNILAQYGNRVSEAAQIPAMQRDDLADVVTAALEGRYGDDGSQAVFQFITEQNPQIDSAVYVQLQQIIEAGRLDFVNAQTILVDQKRIYETALGSFWSGTMMSLAGYPTIDLAEYAIVSTTRANDVFDSGVEEIIQLR